MSKHVCCCEKKVHPTRDGVTIIHKYSDCPIHGAEVIAAWKESEKPKRKVTIYLAHQIDPRYLTHHAKRV